MAELDREKLVEVMARAICLREIRIQEAGNQRPKAEAELMAIVERDWPEWVPSASAALLALEASGVRLVNFTALAEDDAAVERVARAMCIANDNNPDDILTSENLPRWQLWTIEARAAIRAMGD